METIDYLTNYYSNYDEENRLTSKHGKVEFLTTIKYIEKYLFPQAKILEIGAGTGRYSHSLAQMGYDVSAVELIEHNINIFKSKTIPEERISIAQGNALDLKGFPDNSFDLVLLLGPMYHLYTVKEQLTALSEALRVTKTNGILFTAYCISDASLIEYGFKQGNFKLLVEKGLVDTDNFNAKSNPEDLFQLYRKSDIDRLMLYFKTERLHYVATDGATNFMRETVDAMDDEMYGVYLKYHFKMCEREDLAGATHHSLDIVRKLKYL